MQLKLTLVLMGLVPLFGLGCIEVTNKPTKVASQNASDAGKTAAVDASDDSGADADETPEGGATDSDGKSEGNGNDAGSTAEDSGTKPQAGDDQPTSEEQSSPPPIADELSPPAARTSPKQEPTVRDFTLFGEGDWNQWGGSPDRNNVRFNTGIPTEWEPGEFSRDGAWIPDNSRNVKWVAPLGSQTYGNPVVANGQVYVGTNNGHGWLKRYAPEVDLGCLLAFRENDGGFLWQHTSEKLPTGRVHDWPLQGICCSPLVEGERLWFVTSRGEVRCVDAKGFLDDENDGPYVDEPNSNKDEADVIWSLDMMKELSVSQHNMANCSVTAVGDVLYVHTSNGVDESHENLPAPSASSFIAVDKNSGKILWTDESPGENILHGQWSSPAYAVIDGVPQVVFPGGDGWVYSFHGANSKDGKPELLWKFDCNPKKSVYKVSGAATRNHIIGTPVIYNGYVYIAVGEDPEHGEGVGHLWCIDPTRRGDVSPTLVFNAKDPETPIAHKRLQACVEADGDFERDNPNTAAVWHYAEYDANGDGKLKFEEKMHRTCGTVAIHKGLLFIVDFSGLVHCLDANTGKVYWTHDMLSASWGSPLIADDRVYLGDEDGDVTIVDCAPTKNILFEVNMGSSVYTSPVAANGVLYLANKSHLFAIAEGATPVEGSDSATGNPRVNSPAAD